jgi:hypothetical protein
VLADPELAKLTTDIVILRAINRINATPKQLERLTEVLRELVVAEGELRTAASEVMADERARLLAAKPGERPLPPGEDLQAIKSLVQEFQEQVRAAEAEADKVLDPEQIRAFRMLMMMTRGERAGEPRDRAQRPKGEGPMAPDMNAPQPPPPPGPGNGKLGEQWRERVRERMAKVDRMPRPPVPLERVVELMEEKLAALKD